MALAEVPRRVRVVLADDAAEIRMLMRLGLQLDGRFEVVAEAKDGEEAVRACEEHRPDVVVLDLAMPVMDGLEALPVIRARSPRTRVVVLSAFSSHQMAKTARTAGADAYLEKGAATEHLVAVIARLAGLVAPAPRRVPASAASAAPGEPSPLLPATPAPSAPAPDAPHVPDAPYVPDAPAVDAPAVDDILDVVRHELRTPLVLADGFARLVSSAIDSEDTAAAYDRLDDLQRNLQRALDLLDVLATTDGIDDADHVEVGEVDVTALVRHLAPDLDAIATAHKVVVAAPQRVFVVAEETRLAQVLVNLVSNAAKFSPEGTTIEVTVVSVRGFAEVSVRDEGAGVPVGDEERIFTRFGRLSRDHATPGAGMGLYLSRRIARAFGGDVVFQRPEGAGSRFVVRMPLAAAVR